jgi:hypothetical protein
MIDAEEPKRPRHDPKMGVAATDPVLGQGWVRREVASALRGSCRRFEGCVEAEAGHADACGSVAEQTAHGRRLAGQGAVDATGGGVEDTMTVGAPRPPAGGTVGDGGGLPGPVSTDRPTGPWSGSTGRSGRPGLATAPSGRAGRRGDGERLSGPRESGRSGSDAWDGRRPAAADLGGLSRPGDPGSGRGPVTPAPGPGPGTEPAGSGAAQSHGSVMRLRMRPSPRLGWLQGDGELENLGRPAKSNWGRGPAAWKALRGSRKPGNPGDDASIAPIVPGASEALTAARFFAGTGKKRQNSVRVPAPPHAEFEAARCNAGVTPL